MKIPAAVVGSVTLCTLSQCHYVSFVIWKRMRRRNDVGRRWNGRSVGVGMRVGGMVEVERIGIVVEEVVVAVAGGRGKAVVVVGEVEAEGVGEVVVRGVEVGVDRVRGQRASREGGRVEVEVRQPRNCILTVCNSRECMIVSESKKSRCCCCITLCKNRLLRMTTMSRKRNNMLSYRRSLDDPPRTENKHIHCIHHNTIFTFTALHRCH